MPLDDAFEKSIRELREQSPFVVASKSGASYDDGAFRLRFFNRAFLISYPDIKVKEADAKAVPPEFLQVLLLHYLVTATGKEVADKWIGYRNLPGAYLFESKFSQGIIGPLIHAFGKDIAGFRQAGLSLGGAPMTRTGDAAFRFLALPRIPMACILYLGDEAAPFYLPTEDLFLVGNYLSTALRRYKG
jgi:hypothetical protein